MSPRGVGGRVAAAAIGAVVGAALGIGIDRAFTRSESGATSIGERFHLVRASEARVVPESLDASPDRSPSPVRDEIPAARIETDATADSLANADDPLARLRGQLADLEAEVARLRAQLADGSARRHALHGLIAANELRHGKLYEEIFGLAVDDPESIAEDPRLAFDLILRLIDETGLAGAKLNGESREIEPEPAAPDVRLSLSHSAWDDNVQTVEGAPPILWHYDSVQFHATLQLQKVPEGWLGEPFAAEVELSIQQSNLGPTWLIFRLNANSHDHAQEIRWNLNVEREGVFLTRFPIRGAEDSREATIADLAKERSWLDRIFQQLMTRAR